MEILSNYEEVVYIIQSKNEKHVKPEKHLSHVRK